MNSTAAPAATAELGRITPGTTVNHPTYGRITVTRQVNRGELASNAGFAPGTYVEIPGRGEVAVYARTIVTIEN